MDIPLLDMWTYPAGNGQDGTKTTKGSKDITGHKKPHGGGQSKNVRMQDEIPNTLPQEIEEIWSDIRFSFMEGNPEASKYEQSLRLDICKVQFALTSRHKEKSIDILKKNGVKILKIDRNKLQVQFEHSVEPGTELKNLERVLEQYVINDYDSIEIDLASAAGKRILRQLKEKSLEATRVYICKATKTLFVIGEKSKLKSELGLPEGKELVLDVFLDDSYLLGYLGFEEHIERSFSNSKAHVTQDPPRCIIETHGDQIIDGEKQVQHFLSKLKSKRLEVNGDECDKLFFDQYPNPNDTFYLFIQKKMSEQKFQHNFFITKSETGEYLVNSVDEPSTQKVAAIIAKNVISFAVNLNDDIRIFLEEWSKKKKLSYKNMSASLAQIHCTSDIYQGLLELEGFQSFPLLEYQQNFLTLFGDDILSDIEKRFGVKATVCKSVLTLGGKIKMIEESERDLESKLRGLSKSIPLGTQVELIENRKEEIDRSMKERMCVWNLRSFAEPDTMLMNCQYLASWIDPQSEFRVTVVNGFSWHMNLDLHIVLTNQCLYPLEMEHFPTVPKDFIEAGKKVLSGRKNIKMDVGTSTRFLSEMEGVESKNTVALVVQCDGEDMNSCSLDITQKIKEILETGVGINIKNFGISSAAGKHSGLIIKNTITAAKDFVDANPGKLEEMFICCHMEETEVLQIINNIFKMTHGNMKKVYATPGQRFKSDGPSIKIKVKERLLYEMKADVIVNTTNQSLQLKEGRVSSAILEKAGRSLLDECKSKYPNGLLPGEVGVTGAHGLKNLHFIYHISLPAYNYDKFRENIKKYVQKCLSQAERDGCLCIAFPALGMGKLQYPRRETVAAIFDAVEEYCTEVVNPVLKSVKFAVRKDDTLTWQAFCDEEWRRSKRCQKELGVIKPLIKPDITALWYKTDKRSPSLKITTKADIGIPPAYAIQVFLSKDRITSKVCRKRASASQPSWNDQMFLQEAESSSKLKLHLNGLLDDLGKQQDRVTELAIYTNEDSMPDFPEENQAKCMFCFFSKKETVYLKYVSIVVSDEESLQRTKELLRKDLTVAAPDKCNRKDRQRHKYFIEVVGKTKTCLDEGVKFIDNLLLDKDNKIVTKTKMSTVAKASVVHTNELQESSNNKSKVADEVTAEINQGIVRFKKTADKWDAWIQIIGRTFHLKVHSSADKVTVCGDFHSILKFEAYLDKDFPDDPAVA